MLKKVLCAWGAASVLALLPAPALAQDDADAAAMEEFAALSEMFAVEPLTPEQEARLPQARELMSKMMPDGMMAELVDSMMGGILGPMLEAAGPDVDGAFLEATGYSADELGLTPEQAEQALAIVDPAWQQRQDATNAQMQAMVTEMMTTFEPVMREAMSEVYAVYFDDQQLADINTFFSTETGAYFAQQSMVMASDPRLMAAMFEQPDLLLGSVASMAEGMEAAVAGIPEMRSYDDLSPQERVQLTELTGISDEDLQYAIGSLSEASEESAEAPSSKAAKAVKAS